MALWLTHYLIQLLEKRLSRLSSLIDGETKRLSLNFLAFKIWKNFQKDNQN